MSSPRSAEPAFRLTVSGSENDGMELTIGPDGLLVGRSSPCDIVFRSRQVSRRHAYFYCDGESCYVEDLGSRNGLLVNGRKVEKEVLQDGDIVDIGPSCFIVSSGSSRGALAGWLLAGAKPRGDTEGASAKPKRVAGLPGLLGLFGMGFAALAYLHWVFGLCGVLLALLGFWETRGQSFPLRRALLAGGLVVGLSGAALHGWFEGVAPALREKRELEARQACKEQLTRIRSALYAYSGRRPGEYPDRLGELVSAGMLEPGTLLCPGCRMEAAEACRYLYFPPEGGLRETPHGVLVCDESLDNHQGRGSWVLRRDGRIDWVAPRQFERLLKHARAAPQNRSAKGEAGQ